MDAISRVCTWADRRRGGHGVVYKAQVLGAFAAWLLASDECRA